MLDIKEEGSYASLLSLSLNNPPGWSNNKSFIYGNGFKSSSIEKLKAVAPTWVGVHLN